MCVVHDAAEHALDGWINVFGYCYLYFSQKRNWQDAQDSCVAHGAKLVSIETPMENEFIKSLVPRGHKISRAHPGVWIGVSDQAKEGDWSRWVDGTPMLYKDFQPGEPNNLGKIKYTQSANCDRNTDQNCFFSLSYNFFPKIKNSQNFPEKF